MLWLRALHARAENVAVLLMTVMFMAFILQVIFRYVLNQPLGWTQELCLTMWLWVVFWGAAFILRERDHVSFDVLALATPKHTQRIFALISALAIASGLLVSLPASLDYIAFYSIKSSATMNIRLDYVFSVYGIFAFAIIVRYAWRAWRLAMGAFPDDLDRGPAS